MTNRPRDSEGVVVPLWAEVLMLIMEFREALINKHPKKNVGLIQGSRSAELITWIWPKNGRFVFRAILLLWAK